MDYAFVTVDYVQGTGGLSFTGSADRTWLLSVVQAVSEDIEQYVNREIHPRAETRYYDGEASTFLDVPGLISVGTLKEDSVNDGTYDTTWNGTDYILLPHNANPTSANGAPYSQIQVTPFSVGTQDVFLGGIKNYEITGTYGWISAIRDSGIGASADVGTVATAFDVNAVATGTIEVGHTIVIGSEQMFVRDVGTGTSITVTRAVNGSTAGSHGSGASINYHVYPNAVTNAAFIQSARIFNRRKSSFATEIGNPQTGEFMTFRGLDQDVKFELARFRRIAI